MRKSLFKLEVFISLLLIIVVPVKSSALIVNAENYANKIEDGAVYFIRPVDDISKSWDVPWGDYTNNNGIKIYSNNGGGNQRFILSKQFEDSYRIIPLLAPNKVVKVENDNNDEGKRLVIADEEYSDTKLFSDKFKFEYNNVTQAFKIMTGASNYAKKVALKNFNTSEGNELVQRDLSNDKRSWMEFRFIKTDNLAVNVENTIQLNSYSSVNFNIRVPYSVEYILKVINYGPAKPKITVYNDGHSSVVVSREATTMYHSIMEYITLSNNVYYNVVLENKNANNGSVIIVLMPSKPIYLSTNYDIDDNKSDSVTPFNRTKQHWLSIGYYPIVQANMHKSNFLGTGPNGKVKMNNDYFLFTGHGYTTGSGVSVYDGANKEGFLWWELPDMSGTRLAIWLSCHSARDYNNGGYSSNLARESVVKGAQYGLGWEGAILTDVSHVFINYLAKNISSGDLIKEAVYRALEQTSAELWYWFWSWNSSIFYPSLYTQNSNGEIINYTSRDNYQGQNKTFFNEITTIEDKQILKIFDDHYLLILNGVTKKYHLINGALTNIEYNKPLTNISHDLFIKKQIIGYNEVRYFYAYNENEIIKLAIVNDPSSSIIKYYNITENTQINKSIFDSIFKL